MKDFGIRNKKTGEITARFDIPLEAKSQMQDPDTEELVERRLENIVEKMPDGKVYITGVKEVWIEYKA